MIRFRKAVLGVLLGIFLVTLVSNLAMPMYCEKLPSVPDEKAGRTYEMLVNHQVRYGTRGEFRTFRVVDNSVFFVAISSLVGIMLGLKWGILPLRGSRNP